jgi:hypothetical protein
MEVVVVYFNVLSWYWPRETEENYVKAVRIIGFQPRFDWNTSRMQVRNVIACSVTAP